jgi:hypothetical protein
MDAVPPTSMRPPPGSPGSRSRNTPNLLPNSRDNADDERRTPETIDQAIVGFEAPAAEKKGLRAALVA